MTAVQKVEAMSGFARKKALEAAGFEVRKITPQDPYGSGVAEWVVLNGSETIAYDRLQGEAVSKAIEALGGL